MNTIQFIGKTYQGSLSIEDILNFFDHTIIAYDILGDVDIGVDMNRIFNPSSPNSFVICIRSVDKELIDSLLSYINDTLHNRSKDIYGRTFNIELSTDGISNTFLSIQEIIQ